MTHGRIREVRASTGDATARGYGQSPSSAPWCSEIRTVVKPLRSAKAAISNASEYRRACGVAHSGERRSKVMMSSLSTAAPPFGAVPLRLDEVSSVTCVHRSLRQDESVVAARGHLVADLAILRNAADVGHENSRLAGHVRAHVPGIRLAHERLRCRTGHPLDPSLLGLRRGLDRREAVLAQVADAV